jgi:hypothetical protein
VEYGLLKFFHLVGAVLMGGGLIGVWMADLRSRQLHELKPFSEAVRNIAVFYDGDRTVAKLRPIDAEDPIRVLPGSALSADVGDGDFLHAAFDIVLSQRL